MKRTGAAVVVLLVVAVVAGVVCCQEQGAPGPPPATNKVDWSVVASNLEDDLAQAREANAGAAADVRDSNLPLAAIEIEKIRQRLNGAWRDARWDELQQRSQQRCQEALERLAKGEVAFAGQTGGEGLSGYLERAYFAPNDGSPQPYFVRLPADYDPAKAYPLLVFLHGYVPDTAKSNPWVLPPQQWRMAADRGYILCLTHGRRNTDFLGVGEQDTLDVLAELNRWYHVDPDRVFMTGCSMGGYGGWAIGLRRPSRFAALAIMSGQTDFFLWERRDRDEVGYKSWCILQNNPIDLAVNARWLPMLLQHGENDQLVPTEHSRVMVPVLQQLGYGIEYHEIRNQGHYIYWEDEPFQRMFDWCLDKRRVAAPKRVTFKTFTPQAGQAYWTDIRRLTRWGPAGELDAVVDGGRVTVTTSNVAELWFDLPPELLPEAGGELTVNGHAAGHLGRGPHRVVIDHEGAPRPAEPGTPPAERPRTGPAREVFNGPFLVVCATGSADEARRQLDQTRAARFWQLWYAFAEGLCEVVPDTALTTEQVKSHNLVIFGEPSDVTLPGIDDPAATIPKGISLAAGRYQVGSHIFEGDNLGMYLLVPHPLDPQRLILWCSGVEYGAKLPVNHQFDLLPDLLVYNDQADWDGTNQYLVGGFLSPDWVLDEGRLDVAARGPGQ